MAKPILKSRRAGLDKRNSPKLKLPLDQNIQARLNEAEETLRAIRNGEADALVVRGPKGDQVFTLKGADHSYRLLVEFMSEGALTVSREGIILYANKRFAEIVRKPLQKVIGHRLQSFVHPSLHEKFLMTLKQGLRGISKDQIVLQTGNSAPVPVYLSITALKEDDFRGACIVVTDLTSQKQNEERLQQLSRRLLEVQEFERRHLARELHDEIGQLLTGLKLSIARSTFLKPEAFQGALDECQNELDEVIKRVQDLSLSLRPGMLDDLGLLPALSWQIERFRRSTNIKVHFRHRGLKDRRFSSEIETTVYRIVQEALTNVARHAKARDTRVRIQADKSELLVIIQDHGVGFDLAAVSSCKNSNGLSGMRERADFVGGSIDIRTKVGGGTLLRARLPLSHRK